MNDSKSSKNSEGIYEPFNIEDVPWEEFKDKNGDVSRFRVLGKYGGGKNVGVGIDELEPGRFSNQFHYHLTEEEHVLILKGSATLHLGDKSFIMKEGDFCCFPAGQKAGHHLFNHTDTNCTFLTIGENRPHDVYYYPKTGTARIKGTGETFKINDLDRPLKPKSVEA
jgi:uncharacterized cupin superfamily protein